jgi:golgi phosphoprotein 3
MLVGRPRAVISIALSSPGGDNSIRMKLSLAEELLLLCLDDQSGRIRPMPDRALDYALAGAILADLANAGEVKLSEEAVAWQGEATMPSSPVHRRAVELLRTVEDPNLQSWLGFLASESRQLRQAAFEQLVGKGILAREENEFLWIFRTERYETLDLSEEIEVQQRIRAIVLDPACQPSRAETVLVALIEICQLGPLMFSHAEFERSRERIREIAGSDCVGCAVRHALTEIQRAMLEIRAYSGM